MSMTFPTRRLLMALSLCALSAHLVIAQGGVAVPSRANPEQGQSVSTDQNATPRTAEQPVHANEPPQPETQPKEKKKHLGRGSLVIAPIPISSPAIGSGAVLAAAYIFPLSKTDKVSPPSVIGVAGLFTNNDTRAFALGAQFYFKQNTYKVTAGFGRGNLNYDLYGSGVFTGFKLPLKQTGQLFHGEFLRRVGWKFFLGPRFSTGSSTLTLRPSSGNTPPSA